MSTVEDDDYAGATHAAANDTMRYREGVGFGRIFLFIGGLGMLFIPVHFLVTDGGTHPAPAQHTTCEWMAERYPDQDPTTVGCPPKQ